VEHIGERRAVDQLLAVDREFAACAAEHGTGAAFKTFMESADSRAFNGGGPTRGAKPDRHGNPD
jgi:hypothetical protein